MQNIFFLICQKCSKINGAHLRSSGLLLYYSLCHNDNTFQLFFVLHLCISYVLFVDIFTRSFDDFISITFLIAMFLPASPFIPTSLFINFGDFRQPSHLLHPPHLLFWPTFTSLPVYSTLPFYLKLGSNGNIKESLEILSKDTLLNNIFLGIIKNIKLSLHL